MELLIVEDDADFAAAFEHAMQKRDCKVALAHDAVEARAVASNRPDSRRRRPQAAGRVPAQGRRAARRPRPGAAIVLLTGYASIATAVEAVRLGARHYLTKPANADETLAALLRDQPDAGHDGNIPATAALKCTVARCKESSTITHPKGARHPGPCVRGSCRPSFC